MFELSFFFNTFCKNAWKKYKEQKLKDKTSKRKYALSL